MYNWVHSQNSAVLIKVLKIFSERRIASNKFKDNMSEKKKQVFFKIYYNFSNDFSIKRLWTITLSTKPPGFEAAGSLFTQKKSDEAVSKLKFRWGGSLPPGSSPLRGLPAPPSDMMCLLSIALKQKS
jgi:hypothetical protein